MGSLDKASARHLLRLPVRFPFRLLLTLTLTLAGGLGLWPGAGPGGQAHAQEQAEATAVAELEPLLFHYQVAREELRIPLATLQAKYDQALERLAEKVQKAGLLEQVMAVKREREGFREGSFVDQGAFPDLVKLRDVYRRELERQSGTLGPAEARLRTGLIGQLDALKQELTRKSRLDDALKVAAAVEKLGRERSLVEEARIGKTYFVLRDPDAQVDLKGSQWKRQGDLFEITLAAGAQVGRFLTKEPLQPPFTAKWVIATDGGNLRFYYAGFLAFLNHESGRDTLEVCDPVAGRDSTRMIPGMGRIAANEFHEIQLVVERDRYAFLVNGEPRAEGRGDYSAVQAPLAFGPAYGSRLLLRRFEIER